MRKDPNLLAGAKAYYANHWPEFINHWVDTYDPRKAGRGKLSRMPLVMFTRQEDLVEFIQAMLDGEEDGLIEKCRDMGATWICCAVSVCIWLFRPGAAVGWGSRKQDLVDRIGVPDSIFEKIRMIIKGLPAEFMPDGFNPDEHLTFMRCVNPANGSTITGEAGDNIGRGGRNLIYFKDESAHYERPEKIEAALGDNTRVQIDISSVNGIGNVFHRRRESGEEWVDGPAIEGKTNVFVMDWREHPEKDQRWYDKRRTKAINDGLKHIFAQEIDRNYSASVEGVIIPSDWVAAAIGAAEKLGFAASGQKVGGLDVADDGGDRNAFAVRQGPCLLKVSEWGEGDVGSTARRAISEASELGNVEIQYDSVGVGAGVRSEANRLIETKEMPAGLTLVAWSAGASPQMPKDPIVEPSEDAEENDITVPTNGDFYANLKAQAWWQLRLRFERTYRAVYEGLTYDADDLISLDPDMPFLSKLCKELSQATVKRSASNLKLMVNKSPEGTRSPNLADSVVMAYWPIIDMSPTVGVIGRNSR